MPATSGVAALVPPTNVMPCCGRVGAALDAARADDRVAGALVGEGRDVGHHPLARVREGLRRAATTAVARTCSVPPPPPAVAVNGAGRPCRSRCRSRRCCCRSSASGSSRPPPARTARWPARTACGFLSAEVSLLGETPRAQADEPVSPAATTTVMPSADSAASVRSTSVRDSEYGDTFDSHSP